MIDVDALEAVVAREVERFELSCDDIEAIEQYHKYLDSLDPAELRRELAEGHASSDWGAERSRIQGWVHSVEVLAHYALGHRNEYEALRLLPKPEPGLVLPPLEQMLAEDRRYGYLGLMALRNARHSRLARALLLVALKVLRCSQRSIETFRVHSQRSLDRAVRAVLMEGEARAIARTWGRWPVVCHSSPALSDPAARGRVRLLAPPVLSTLGLGSAVD